MPQLPLFLALGSDLLTTPASAAYTTWVFGTSHLTTSSHVGWSYAGPMLLVPWVIFLNDLPKAVVATPLALSHLPMAIIRTRVEPC